MKMNPESDCRGLPPAYLRRLATTDMVIAAGMVFVAAPMLLAGPVYETLGAWICTTLGLFFPGRIAVLAFLSARRLFDAADIEEVKR